MKDTLKTYCSFNEWKEKTLTYRLKSGNILKFIIFEKSKTADLYIEELTEEGYKERPLIFSFTFDNYEHKEFLNKLMENTVQ